MHRIIKILWWLSLACGLSGTTFWWMNRDTRWDANGALAKPGERASGRVGVILVGVAQPSHFEKNYWIDTVDKLVATVIPWPVNRFVGADKGVVLMDPGHPYAPRAFTPTQLLDVEGRARDARGVPWMERYQRGEIIWSPPSATLTKDMGVFVCPGQKQGLSTLTAKTSAKARYLYYGQLKDGYLPHADQIGGVAAGALSRIKAQHPDIVTASLVGVSNSASARRTVWRILDSGVDTLVLGSTQPIYSDFEDMRAAFSRVHDLVEAWRVAHANKPVRLLIAPGMSTEAAFDALWLAHFGAVVPAASGADQMAVGIISLHGLPLALGKSDSWSTRWPAVTRRMKPKMEAILRAKGYARVQVEVGAEVFADPLSDPDGKAVSVNELFAKARRDRATVAVALPVEFLAESTDTLFAHAAVIWDDVPGVTPYAPPPRDQNWSKPYVRRAQAGGTLLIYAGAPGGEALPRASDALASAVGRVLPVGP
jgi:hypothetical protein